MKSKYLLINLMLILGSVGCTADQQVKQVKNNMNTTRTPVVISQDTIPIPQYQRSPSNVVMRLVWHPNGQEFAVIDDRLHILVFNANTKRLIREIPTTFLRGSNKPVIAYSPDGRYLAAGKNIIQIFDSRTGVTIQNLVPPTPQDPGGRGLFSTASIAFSPDSQSLAAAYDVYWLKDEGKPKEAIAIYDVMSGKQHSVVGVPDYHSQSSISTNIVYTLDGKYILAGRWSLLPYDERVKTGALFRYFTFIDYINSQTGQLSQSIASVHTMGPTALAISPDGRYVASGTDTGTSRSPRRPNSDKSDYINNQDPVKLWDIKTHELIREYPIKGKVRALAISPDERYLAVHNNLEIVLFDFATGEYLQTITLPGTPGFSLSLALGFSSDGKKLAIPLDERVYILMFK